MQMAEKGNAAMAEMDKAVNNMMAEANEAKAQGKIEPVFYKRYTRILMLLRLIKNNDPEGILWPLMEREIFSFVEDVKGEEVSDIKGAKGIVVFADAIAEEILNLQLYLDNKENRDKLREEFKEKLKKAGFYQGAKVKK
jgi:DNA gyrase/topoisomerase IV subunit A